MMICETCKYAEWEMTNHKIPKINKKKPGECKYQIDKDKTINQIKEILPTINTYYDVDEWLRLVSKRKTLWVDYIINECHFYEKK